MCSSRPQRLPRTRGCGTQKARHQNHFATKYKLILPSEEEFRAELLREQELIADQGLAPISADILALEQETEGLLSEITGGKRLDEKVGGSHSRSSGATRADVG